MAPVAQRFSVEWRREFVLAVRQRGSPFAVLCRQFHFSRQTGYRLWRRFQSEGLPGLAHRSRAPHGHGQARAAHWHERLRELRRKHPRWGPKKWHALLPGRRRPAVATLGRWLRQMGLTQCRRPRPRRGPVRPGRPLTVPRRSNQVWTVDFKGSFCTGDGTRVHPLTVRDLFSRYVLCVRVWTFERHDPVRGLFARLFRRYGWPQVIRCDHGVPWASTGPLSLSRLSVWWWSLGIRVEFTAKGCPGQNGAHEQHHRVLKAETARPPARTLPGQQRRLDRWRRDYNHLRPHEALGQKVPGARYHSKPGPGTTARPPARYGRAAAVRSVHTNGEIAWEGHKRFVGDAFAGQHVGLYRLEEGVWSVRFLHLEIGRLHRTDPGGMRPVSASPPLTPKV